MPPRKPKKRTKKDALNATKAARRNAMIAAGAKMTPPPKVHKSVKDYQRKPKHPKKLPPDDEL